MTNKVARLIRRLLDPGCSVSPSSGATYAAFDAGPLHVGRLEERRVLAADLAQVSGVEENATSGEISTLATPVISVPGSQTTTEGATLVFSPAAGREIRVDAPGLGSGLLRVDISAFESLGQVLPILSFGTTAGLTVTGNGTNVFQLQGTLVNINAALASLTFYSPDNGDFVINLVAADATTGENDSASIDIDVMNAPPQISIPFNRQATEGSSVEVSIQLFDPGALDNPQVSWVVSRLGVAVASGAGTQVQFFAPDDGNYKLAVSAVDKDNGVSADTEFIDVINSSPVLTLNGEMQNGVVNLSVYIDDPGQELFFVTIYWTSDSATPETRFTSERVLSFSHQYTAEELAQAGELITVQVADNKSVARQSLQFRDGEAISAERPEFAARPQEVPPERIAAARPQLGGTTSQIVSADFGRAVAQSTQAAPALHQFVLRVVSSDGEESESYPLPGEALANLPAFLTNLGVPDGHYRVYLVMGELERLVIDGHLRSGRIVDPTDESQSGLNFARGEVATHPAPDRRGIVAIDSAEATSQIRHNDEGVSGEVEPVSTDSKHNHVGQRPASITEIAAPDPVPTFGNTADVATSASTATHHSDDHFSDVAMQIVGGAIVVAAATTMLSTTASRRNENEQLSHRFCKRARLARKLARPQPIPARV